MFNRVIILLLMSSLLSSCIADKVYISIDKTKLLSIENIKPKGKYYEEKIPDTLDLAERAKLAINVLTRNVEPKMYYGVYQALHFDPMQACALTWNITPKNLRALPFLRTICGSEQNLQTEYEMMNAMINEISENGQMYYPFAGAGAPKGTSYPHINALTILAMENFFYRDSNPEWIKLMGLISKGLIDIAVQRENRCYYPPECGYSREGEWLWTLRGKAITSYTPPDEPIADNQGLEGAVKSGQVRPLRALVKYYQLSGNQQALEMARRIKNFVLKPAMWVDTSVDGYPGYEHGIFNGHFHNNTIALLALLDLAIATDDQGLKQFVREAYEHARRNGVTQLGWYPGWITPEKLDRPKKCASITESCGLADMLMLGVKLSDAGLGDYWDDVDAIIRNQLAEQQFVDKGVLRKFIKAADPDQGVKFAYTKVSEEDITIEGLAKHDELIDRFHGGFSMGAEPAMMCSSIAGCCTANGALSLYYAWHGITRFDKGTATVNLFLNRASDWMDINSYLPYEGKVVLKNKKAKTVLVRIPNWCDSKNIKVSVDNKLIKNIFAGRYLVLENLKENMEILLKFPLPAYSIKRTIYGTEYTLTFKGSTLIDINPRTSQSNFGSIPIYQRDYIKKSKCPIKKTTRFISQHILPIQ